ncbi:fimbrial major subunit CsuA/B family protein [Xylophilus rhododendri]|uniref:Fimbrial major subunit CsuA/B family protein n=1 Tax=Xylophilus rhododendri TaxID=2697032 RepID=A0A857J574_9BURK|nr:spore coat U domain-containing protein [Xylophilus rhododendri]QHI98976.1 fimbrial major subunit CsuA/B family protein [Xylophilus rhododendri]
MRRCLARLLVLLACLAGGAAWGCSFVTSGNALGSVSSFVVRSGPVRTGTAVTELRCNGVVLALGNGNPVLSASISGATTGLTLKNGTDSIPYSVTAASGTPYSTGQLVVSANGANLVSLLGSNGARVPFNITTGLSANVAAGIYTDTLTVLWTYANICEGVIGLGDICVGVPASGTNVPSTLQITLTVTNDCAINAPDIQFGSAPLLSAFPVVSQNMGFLCTKGMVYTVGLSAGGSPLAGRRQMSSGTNRLQYDIFKPDSTVWGLTAGARANAVGIPDGTTNQLMPYTARIYTDQPLPAAGIYTDSITVDVGF